MPLDELVRRADATLPGAKTVLVGLPATPQTALQVRKKFPQELDEFGWSVVHLNQYTGEVLRVENALKAPLAKQFVGVIYPLHVGVVGGLGVKYLYVLLGLTPIALFIIRIYTLVESYLWVEAHLKTLRVLRVLPLSAQLTVKEGNKGQ